MKNLLSARRMTRRMTRRIIRQILFARALFRRTESKRQSSRTRVADSRRKRDPAAFRFETMANAILADFLAFNDLVAGLARAGVSLHLGLPRKGAAEACEQIGAVVARRVGEGASLQEALRDRAVPEAYRCVAQLAMISGDPEAALGEAGREVVCDDDSRALWAALRYPLMVCGLAYVGMILFCVLLAPLLNDAYQWMEVSVGWGMAAVNWLRAATFCWVVGAPLLLLAIIVYIRDSRASGARASSPCPAR